MQLTSTSAAAGRAHRAARPARARAARRARACGCRSTPRRRPRRSSAHTAARALPPAPSTSARLPAGGSPIAAIRPRRVGVLRGDRAVGRDRQRVRRADRLARRRSRCRPAPARRACAGSSRWRRRSPSRRARARSLREQRRRRPAAADSASRRIPSEASAALCIAGERLCATGQPSTPRRLATSSCTSEGARRSSSPPPGRRRRSFRTARYVSEKTCSPQPSAPAT